MNATTQTTATPPANGKRRTILAIVALVFIAIAVLWGLYWFFVLSKREQTDDAYVNGNQVVVSAQVQGTVVAVLADNTQPVKAGEVLVRLDPTDSQVALNKASSALAQAVRQVRQQRSTAGEYDAVVATRRLELARTQADLAKREPLLADQAIAGEELRHAREAVALAQAALTQAERQAVAAHALVDGANVAENPTVLAAKDAFRDAWIAAQRNAVLAPVSGYVAERSVQLGSHIQPGQPLLTVVPLDNLWVDANFKEVQLRHLRIGQPALVRSDLYGGTSVFHGRVQGLSAGTGAAFSLLPAQNASGNWIKVVQRVPVRIAIDPRDLKDHPLRVGLSATVTVDISRQEGGDIAAAPPTGAADSTDVYSQDIAKANAEADAVIQHNLGSAP